MTITRPDKISTAWAADAATTYINDIPVSDPVDPQRSSWESGFRPITMTPEASGGLPPYGQDFNGVLNALSSHTLFTNTGGQYRFDGVLATIIGGYDEGTVLQSNDGKASYRSAVNNNLTNFNTIPSSIGTLWMPWAGSSIQGNGYNLEGRLIIPYTDTGLNTKREMLIQWGRSETDSTGEGEKIYAIPYGSNPFVIACDYAAGDPSNCHIVSVTDSPTPLTKAKFFAATNTGAFTSTSLFWIAIGRK
jgi:hypothetical protein